MQETRRQHYVPRTYLKHFAVRRNKSFNIHAVDKDNLTKIFSPNISNICLETDIYTLKGDTKEQRQAIEAFYSNHIESTYDEIYEVLTDEKISEISAEMHYKIVMTIITMMYRTSKWLHTHNSLIDSVLERMFSLCNQTGKDYFIMEDKKYSIKGKTLQEVQQEFRSSSKDGQVLTQLEVAFRLIKIRQNDGIFISRLLPEHKLITSDNPVLLSNLTGGHIAPFDPENIIKLPLDSQHILTIMPHSHSYQNHRITRMNDNQTALSMTKLIANNGSQLASSFKYILGSKDALSQYLTNKTKYDQPVTESQLESLSKLEEMLNNYFNPKLPNFKG